MRFHHVCLVVSDMTEALKLWEGTLGFAPYIDTVIPDQEETFFAQATLDDIFGVSGARSRMVMLSSPAGAKIELQQPMVPVPEVPTRVTSYGQTGITEVALQVEAIDEWFQTVRAAGYETQTDYVWSVGGGRLKSFLFYDADRNLVQFCEEFDVKAAT